MKKFILTMALAITAGVYTAHAQDVITDPVAAQAQQEAMNPIQEKVLKAVQEVANSEGYAYVFDVNGIVAVGAQSVDITDKVKTKVGVK